MSKHIHTYPHTNTHTHWQVHTPYIHSPPKKSIWLKSFVLYQKWCSRGILICQGYSVSVWQWWRPSIRISISSTFREQIRLQLPQSAVLCSPGAHWPQTELPSGCVLFCWKTLKHFAYSCLLINKYKFSKKKREWISYISVSMIKHHDRNNL